MTTYTQLFSNISEQSAHQTFPFPFTFGQNTVHNCWIQTGYINPLTIQRTNFKQHYYYRIWDPLNTVWLAPKCKLTTDLILLYTSTNNTNDLNANLPQYLSLTLLHVKDPQEIYEFIHPTAKDAPLPTRYFTSFHRQCLINHLLTFGEAQNTLDSIVWSEPAEGSAEQAALAIVNQDPILTLALAHRSNLSKKIATKQIRNPKLLPLRTQFFKLYTLHDFGPERPDDLGWPNPQSLKERELTVLSPEGRVRPETIARWAKWDAVYEHWDNPEALSATGVEFTAWEIAHLTSLYAQVIKAN